MARIIPVLDVMNGVVVRGVAGNRGEYRPMRSRLTSSTDPITVAHALLEVTGSQELYVADLDAIVQASLPNARTGGETATRLARAFPRTTVLADVGARSLADLPISGGVPNLWPILATESLQEWPPRLDDTHPDGLAFGLSLDFRQGEWLGPQVCRAAGGQTSTPSPLQLQMARQLLRAVPARFVIVLDIATVGTRAGPSPFVLELLRHLRSDPAKRASTELIAGGGVRDRDDIARFADAGADAVLVASALHDFRLP